MVVLGGSGKLRAARAQPLPARLSMRRGSASSSDSTGKQLALHLKEHERPVRRRERLDKELAQRSVDVDLMPWCEEVVAGDLVDVGGGRGLGTRLGTS